MPEPFDPERAFIAFYNADNVSERRIALRPQMLGRDYDGWLAGYLRAVWRAGEDALALAGQEVRFVLRYCLEVGSAEALAATDPQYPPVWRDRLAGVADLGGEAADRPRVLAERLEAWLQLDDVADLTPYQRSLVEHMVGDCYSSLWASGEGTTTIDAALDHYERAITHSPRLDCLHSRIYGAAAMMYNKRYDRTHSLRDLDLTLANAELAITTALPGQLDLDDFHGVWAAGLRNTGELIGDAMYWEAAAGAYSQAAELSRQSDPRRELYVSAAGVCVLNAEATRPLFRLPYGLKGSPVVELERMQRIDPGLREGIVLERKNTDELSREELPQDLDAAIVAVERSQSGTDAGDAATAAIGLTLAQLLLTRYTERHEPSDLRRAQELCDTAVVDGENVVAAHRLRVGILRAQGASDGERVEALATGMRLAREHPSSLGLRLAQECAQAAAGRANWALAAEAFDAAAAVHATLVQRQVGRGYQELALTWGPALGAGAAVAHAHCGDAAAAAQSLEFGRAQLLSLALRRDAADLERIRTLGGAELVDRYVSALLRLDAAPRSKEPGVAAQRAQDDLHGAVADIRALDGMGDFLRPLCAADLQAVAVSAGAALLYLAESDHGGVAVAVDSQLRAAPVPGLTHDEARRHAASVTAEPGSAAHELGLERACRWLGGLLAPVLASLALAGRVVLVPCGALGFLPIHAAWLPGPDETRTYLFDALDVCYAANAQALQASLAASRAAESWHTALVVHDPADDPGDPLPLARFEAAAVSAALAAAEFDVAPAAAATATVESVRDRLGDTDVVHVACHAAADPGQPLRGGLLLAGGRLLTVADIASAQVRAQLVVLSACESAAVGQALPDEAVSLPNGLLEAGCAAVVGALWKVDDRAAALVMLGFYDRLRAGLEPSAALAAAQRALRDATNADLLDLLGAAAPGSTDPGGRPDPDPGFRALVRDLTLAEPGDRDFASPALWAAFQYVGG